MKTIIEGHNGLLKVDIQVWSDTSQLIAHKWLNWVFLFFFTSLTNTSEHQTLYICSGWEKIASIECSLFTSCYSEHFYISLSLITTLTCREYYCHFTDKKTETSNNLPKTTVTMQHKDLKRSSCPCSAKSPLVEFKMIRLKLNLAYSDLGHC